MSGQLEILEQIPTFNGDIATDEAARRKVSRDASIFEVMPAGVISPRDTDDIKSVVGWAVRMHEAGTPVHFAPRVGGTCMSGGSLTPHYILDLKSHYNYIGAVDATARTIRVQTGAMHIDVETKVSEAGLLFAPYTSSREICGIGGMIGNNASGEKSIKYGATSENVKSLKVVVGDGNEYEFGQLTRTELMAKKALPTFEGEIYRRITKLLEENRDLIVSRRTRTVKNAAGYALWNIWDSHKQTFNLARLFVGAQGTLGVVTEAELRLIKPGKYQRMIVTPISDLNDIAEVVNTTLRHEPVICETFDHYTYELAEQYHPEDAERAHVARGKHIVILSVFETGSQYETDIIAGKAKEHLERLGHETYWIDDQAVIDSFLLIRRASFKMLLDHPLPNTRAEAFLEDTIVPLERYGEFLHRLEAILKEYSLVYTYAGHIGSGSIRLVPLINMEADGSAELVIELESKVNDLVLEFGGSISVDHNDGIIRTPYLEKQFGPEMIELFRQVKAVFDPHGIFNPGKKLDGTHEYALEHIIRENAA